MIPYSDVYFYDFVYEEKYYFIFNPELGEYFWGTSNDL